MNDYRYVGKNILRADGPDKVRGRYGYLADEPLYGALCGAVLFSSRANALVKSLKMEKALELPGVQILTFHDAPASRYNSGEWFPGQNDHPDETVLTGHVRHIGDRIALVLAEDRPTALAARALIEVEYEDLPPVVNIDTAEEMAARLHEDGHSAFPGRLEYGEVDAAFAKAALIAEDTITTPKIHHAAMEPHAVLAVPRPEEVLEIHSPCQIMFGVQHAIAEVLPLPLSKIRVIKVRMGGTFGGKQEVVFEPLCAWAAWKLGRPVSIDTTREETMVATRTRAATIGKVQTALDGEGRILARRFDITADAGAYLSGTKKVMMAMGKKASRLYRLPAMRYEGRALRTSTTPAGACRGYGSPQIHAITEIHTDLMCTRHNIDPVEFRRLNLVEPFDKDPAGAADLGNARVRDCLELGLAAFEWERRKSPSAEGRFRRGAGFACCTHGNGYYKTIYHDVAGMSMRLMEDGSAVLRAGVHELGNAAVPVLAQIAAEVTFIEPGRITVMEGDTLFNNYDIGCQASRGIFVMGECARLCAEKAIEMLLSEAGKIWEGPVRFINGVLHTGSEIISLGEAVRQIEMKRSQAVEVHIQHRPEFNPACYGVHFVDLTVDTLTGLVRIEKYLAVHDVGQAINPSFVKGQIYGGVQMGLGMALTEELAFDDSGRPSARNFDKYHLINAPDMPEVDIILVEKGEEGGPFGAKSIGEVATVPVAPAVVNAVNRALGSEMTVLPLTPARIVAHMAG
ncbi:aldehyde oxidase [Deltaproteobacteria bacterium Smac51]|nr:aldehyde oxidase [Deltaproteobacteria bacterium Smac51]